MLHTYKVVIFRSFQHDLIETQSISIWLFQIDCNISIAVVVYVRNGLQYLYLLLLHVREFFLVMFVAVYSITITRKSQHSQECNDPLGTVFGSRDLDLWPFDPKINAFPGLIVEKCYVEFGDRDPSCIGFWDIVRKNRQTYIQTEVKAPHPRLPSAG